MSKRCSFLKLALKGMGAKAISWAGPEGEFQRKSDAPQERLIRPCFDSWECKAPPSPQALGANSPHSKVGAQLTFAIFKAQSIALVDLLSVLSFPILADFEIMDQILAPRSADANGGKKLCGSNSGSYDLTHTHNKKKFFFDKTAKALP